MSGRKMKRQHHSGYVDPIQRQKKLRRKASRRADWSQPQKEGKR